MNKVTCQGGTTTNHYLLVTIGVTRDEIRLKNTSKRLSLKGQFTGDLLNCDLEMSVLPIEEWRVSK